MKSMPSVNPYSFMRGNQLTYLLFTSRKNPANGSVASGENGTYATVKTKEMGSPFPKGNTWYFTAALLRFNVGAASDFYPTPEGSTEWQESYKDCAEAYYYEPGQAETTFSVNIFNQGEKAITDFRAIWYGQGDDPVKGWPEKLAKLATI